VIRARALTKRFGEHAVLDALDFDVRVGDRVAVLGLNGAGKTTLFRCLLGLVPFEGRLAVDGFDVRHDGRAARARLGYVPQRAPHFEGTLAEWVDFFSRLREVDPSGPESRLAELGLSMQEHGDKPVRALSGGMLQKALLALALGAGVPLLLLDEPTANLDPRARRDFLRAVRQVDSGTTILLASHRLADVEAVADRLWVLHRGRFAFAGAIDELWARIRAEGTLWLKIPPQQRDRARTHLESNRRVAGLLQNGTALGVRVQHAARVDLLFALRDAGIEVQDFWTEAPSMQDLLEQLLGVETADTLRPQGGRV
jgi:ABC-type multidrug transport system ATPase subunit